MSNTQSILAGEVQHALGMGCVLNCMSSQDFWDLLSPLLGSPRLLSGLTQPFPSPSLLSPIPAADGFYLQVPSVKICGKPLVDVYCWYVIILTPVCRNCILILVALKSPHNISYGREKHENQPPSLQKHLGTTELCTWKSDHNHIKQLQETIQRSGSTEKTVLETNGWSSFSFAQISPIIEHPFQVSLEY